MNYRSDFLHSTDTLSDSFPVQNGLDKGYVALPLHFIHALRYSTRKVGGNLAYADE
jgi:hypothetical protein